MNSVQVECFLTAAKCLNFTDAAERLYISQPALSRNIAAFEAEIGMELFVRGHKSSHLTPAGAVLLTGLMDLTEKYESLLESASYASRGLSGTLSIGFMEGQLLDGSIKDVLNNFNVSYPDIDVRLTRENFSGLLNALHERVLDIIFTLSFEAENKESIFYEKICTMKNYLVIPKSHPLSKCSCVKLSDFREDVFIGLAKSESSIVTKLLRSSCLEAGFDPNLIEAPDLKTQILWIEAGRGISAFNEKHMTCNNPLLTFFEVPEIPPVDMVAAWHRDNYNPTVPLFVSGLIE